MTPQEAKEELLDMKRDVEADSWRDKALDMAIKALEQQPCEACISRQSVLDIWHTRYSNIREENEEIQYKKIAFELPSVTPKQKVGKWIYKDGQGQFCSECDTNVIWKFKFCPYCGARMESADNVCKDCHYNDGDVHAECVVCDKVESE